MKKIIKTLSLCALLSGTMLVSSCDNGAKVTNVDAAVQCLNKAAEETKKSYPEKLQEAEAFSVTAKANVSFAVTTASKESTKVNVSTEGQVSVDAKAIAAYIGDVSNAFENDTEIPELTTCPAKAYGKLATSVKSNNTSTSSNVEVSYLDNKLYLLSDENGNKNTGYVDLALSQLITGIASGEVSPGDIIDNAGSIVGDDTDSITINGEDISTIIDNLDFKKAYLDIVTDIFGWIVGDITDEELYEYLVDDLEHSDIDVTQYVDYKDYALDIISTAKEYINTLIVITGTENSLKIANSSKSTKAFLTKIENHCDEYIKNNASSIAGVAFYTVVKTYAETVEKSLPDYSVALTIGMENYVINSLALSANFKYTDANKNVYSFSADASIAASFKSISVKTIKGYKDFTALVTE